MSILVAQIVGGMIGIFLGVIGMYAWLMLRERRELQASKDRAELWQERVHTRNEMPAPVYDLKGRRVR